jgi:hypothetical protein
MYPLRSNLASYVGGQKSGCIYTNSIEMSPIVAKTFNSQGGLPGRI